MANRKPDIDGDDPRSLFALLRELPSLFLELGRAEFERFKREMTRKLKRVSAGAILSVTVLMLGSFLLGTLVLAAVYGLHEFMPVWSAALTVAGIILVVMIVLSIIAVNLFKRSTPLPTETLDSLIEDANALKGQGNYDFD
jgi:CBS domain containing-hemolysin-like protein